MKSSPLWPARSAAATLARNGLYALGYAERGIAVFPLRPGLKTPIYPGGFHRATTDLRQVHAWWRRDPGANIGIACGAALVVIDEDPRHGGNADQLDLPPTVVARTPRGGRHFYYRVPPGVIVRIDHAGATLGAGIDVQGAPERPDPAYPTDRNGCYVVAPPSAISETHDGLRRTLSYVWVTPTPPLADLPPELVDRLARPARADGGDSADHAPIMMASMSEPSAADVVILAAALLPRAITKIAAGEPRNAVGFWLACQGRDRRLEPEQMRAVLLEYQRRVPQPADRDPYTVDEALGSLRQAYRRPPRPRSGGRWEEAPYG
jgi:hypothetical protein